MSNHQLIMNNEQLPEGYKGSAIGLIPEDWEAISIGELEPFITSGSRGWACYYAKYGSPFIRITNLTRESIYLDFADLKYVNLPSGINEGKRTELHDGDILISITADIGIIGYVDNSVPKPSYINQHISLVKFNPKSIETRFIAYFLASENIQRLFRGATDQGAKAGLNLDAIRKLKVALPPLPEQQTIAQALSDTDRLIASLEKAIAKKRAIKTATMQQLLTGKKRLPGFGEGKGYKESAIGWIPEDWGVRGLDSLGSGTIPPIKAGPFGSSLTKNTYVPVGYKVYGQEQVIRGDYFYGEYFISQEKFRQLESCAVKPGDILLSLVGTTGKVLVIPDNAPPGVINPRLLRLTFDKELADPTFFKALFESGEIQDFLTRYAQGGTMGVLNAGMLKSVCIGLPSIEEQQSIATVLSDMDAEITALEARHAKTQAIKQGMMQLLLTGKIRLL